MANNSVPDPIVGAGEQRRRQRQANCFLTQLFRALEFCVRKHTCSGITSNGAPGPHELGLIAYNGQIEIHPSLLNVVLHEEPHINR